MVGAKKSIRRMNHFRRVSGGGSKGDAKNAIRVLHQDVIGGGLGIAML
jgi:hypothetical protein